MDANAHGKTRTRSTVRVVLTPEAADALERRARRNDRFDWSEAARIIREALERDGDLTADSGPERRP
jgi:predicted NAD-dependent protein-ADP-ribosyltransferase YbiA (DUF1768 family)